MNDDDLDRTYREICVWHGHDPLAERDVIAEAETVAREAVAS